MINTPVKINGKSFADMGAHNPDRTSQSVRQIVRDAGDAEKGNIVQNRVVNIQVTAQFSWNWLSTAELEGICEAVGITIPDLGQPFQTTNIDQPGTVLEVEMRTFVGLRTLRMVLDMQSAISATLTDKGNGDGDQWQGFELRLKEISDRQFGQ